jgi:hypothetical protein
MVPAAELRVFQPLEAFPPQEQAWWERYIVAGAPHPVRPRYVNLATPAGLGFVHPAGEDGAHVKVVDGAYFVCPERTRLRVLAGLLAFRDAAPFEGAEAFVPKSEARRARKLLGRMRRRNPGEVAAIMQSPWHVPVRWLVLFDDDERRLGEDELGRLRLRYRTSVRRALRRAGQAIPVLRRSDLGPISELLLDLHEWIALFDTRSLLELDYGSLCDFLTWDELDDDRSVREMGRALDALERREFPRSAEIYQGVLSHWAEIRGHELLN